MKPERIEERNTSELFKEDYQRYAIGTNLRRSIPDVRDGLKTVQRNIIYAMTSEATGYKNYVKSASITGQVMRLYHPHGESSIYEALVNIATWFNSKIPLIDAYGNFGNMKGSGPAASRYTEARLSEFTRDCVLKDLKSDPSIVDYVENYDGTKQQPEYLPCIVPLLLINGANGIGIGKATFIPSHNITEVLDAFINYIKNPDHPVILIPDERMGSDIVDADWKSISELGYGTYEVRSIVEVGSMPNGNPCLIVKTLPDGSNFEKIREKIVDLAKTSLPQIKDIYDNTKQNDLNIIIELEKGSDPEYVKSMLYRRNHILSKKNTVNFNAVLDIESFRLSYKSYFELFYNILKTTKLRLYNSRYSNLMINIHEKDFYIKILESDALDELISKIKTNTKSDEEFIEWMIKKFNITDVQAEYAFKIQLNKLSKLYLNKYKAELREFNDEAKKYLDLLTDQQLFDQSILNELIAIRNKYGESRKSKIIPRIDSKEAIPDGEFTIVVTETGFIKKIQPKDLSSLKDKISLFATFNNRDNALFFTSKAKVYKVPVHRIALMDKNATGIDTRVMFKGHTGAIVHLNSENFATKLANSPVSDEFELVVLTKFNHIKRVALSEFINTPASGLAYSRLDKNDEIINVKLVHSLDELIVFSDRKALRYPALEVPKYGRMANGVMAMGTNEEIHGMSVISTGSNDNYTHIVVVTEMGKFNKFPIEAMQSLTRTVKGSSVINLTKDDKIVAIIPVSEYCNIINVTCANGYIGNIDTNQLAITSSISSGKKIPNISGVIKVELVIQQ